MRIFEPPGKFFLDFHKRFRVFVNPVPNNEAHKLSFGTSLDGEDGSSQ